ncbi:MAG: hypothetical protein IJ690_05210 [Clostridia bacterium]|nr:hypothetical protein [Clostridia bacterium]
MTKKKKIIIISSIVVASFIIIGIVYAFFTDFEKLTNKLALGTLNIEDTEISFKKANGDDADLLEPGDINTLSWTTKNVGTSGALTRQTLELYWTDDLDVGVNTLIYMYPANMTDEAILADYAKGEESEYAIELTDVTRTIEGKNKNGVKYQFIGDTLNGSDNIEVSNEVNYNSDVAAVIDSNINTDDTNKKEDSIAYKILLSPDTSYLYQGRKLSVFLTTEGMQYTEDGSGTWTVEDTQQIP